MKILHEPSHQHVHRGGKPLGRLEAMVRIPSVAQNFWHFPTGGPGIGGWTGPQMGWTQSQVDSDWLLEWAAERVGLE
jgi:hypothetical protein